MADPDPSKHAPHPTQPGENRVAVQEDKLRQRRALDAEVVEDAHKEWRIRFTKEQIGFGGTAKLGASGSLKARR